MAWGKARQGRISSQWKWLRTWTDTQEVVALRNAGAEGASPGKPLPEIREDVRLLSGHSRASPRLCEPTDLPFTPASLLTSFPPSLRCNAHDDHHPPAHTYQARRHPRGPTQPTSPQFHRRAGSLRPPNPAPVPQPNEEHPRSSLRPGTRKSNTSRPAGVKVGIDPCACDTPQPVCLEDG